MAHQTLYRTFRPKTFTDISGQPQVTNVLQKQIEKGMPGHAYLFCGTRGTGKTTTARVLANALNCLSPENGNPCGKCEVCKSFEADAFIDVIEIDAASNNGVDNIRDIREKAVLMPAVGKYKVYIIDEVHMLSTGAYNALLKTLEEPPAHAVFILATTEFRKIPKTIVSRCQRYEFNRIAEDEIKARLAHVADATGVKYEDEALTMLADQSEGALRDALSLMDQCIAGGDTLTKDDVRRTLGLSDDQVLKAMCDAIMSEDAASALSAAAQLQDTGTAPAHIVQDAVSELSRRLSENARDAQKAASLLRSLEILIGVQSSFRYSPAPAAVLTAALVRAALVSTDVDAKNLELRVRKLEDKLDAIASGAKPAASQTAALPGRTQARPAPSASVHYDAPAKYSNIRTKPEEDAPAQGSEADVLARFKDLLKAQGPQLAPPADALDGIMRQGNDVILYATKKNLVLAEMLLMESIQGDTRAVLEKMFGAPAPRLRIEELKNDVPEEDEREAVIATLTKEFGEENVEVITSDN